MTVQELIERLSRCNPEAKVQYQRRTEAISSVYVEWQNVVPEDIEDYGDTVKIGEL
jgi:hypothetical protein